MIITITKHYIIQRGSKTGCGLIYQMECEQVASSSFVFFFCIQFCFKVHAMLVDFFYLFVVVFISIGFFRTFFSVFLFSFHLLDDAPFRVIGDWFWCVAFIVSLFL